MEKTVAFHLYQMSERGTEISTYDYARYNETILGNKSIIIANRKKLFNSFEKFFIDTFIKFNLINANNIKIYSKRQRSTYPKFTKNFKVFFYDDPKDIDLICRENKVDYFYAQKYGTKDDVISNYCRNLMHAIFMTNDFHGERYLYISEWLAKTMTGNSKQFVPYIVDNSNLDFKKNLRQQFNIPDDFTVVSSYGGKRVFDIEFVKEAIKEILEIRKDVVFMFLNIESFYKHPRIHFLPRSINKEAKMKFVNASDYMIHARARGETFGLAIAEFSIRNKPIIAYSSPPEKAHLDILGKKCLVYNNKDDLKKILLNVNRNSLLNANNYYDCYTKQFNPKKVMRLFQERFLD